VERIGSKQEDTDIIRDTWCVNGSSCPEKVCADNGCRLGFQASFEVSAKETAGLLTDRRETEVPPDKTLRILPVLNIEVV
jgi:hypothetical protein